MGFSRNGVFRRAKFFSFTRNFVKRRLYHKKKCGRYPTAFVAEYGSGLPIIAILGEFDALPGLFQQAIPEKKSANGEAGHACGHHLFGTASAAAAISVKQWMKNTK